MENVGLQKERIRQVARDLEAGLLRKMIEEMEKAQLDGGFLGKGPTGRAHGATFRTMLADLLADTQSLGLADQLTEALEKNTESGSKGEISPTIPDSFDFLRWETQGPLAPSDERDG